MKTLVLALCFMAVFEGILPLVAPAKWKQAVKTAADRDALRAGLLDGSVDVVATDHAPHTLEEKEGGLAAVWLIMLYWK